MGGCEPRRCHRAQFPINKNSRLGRGSTTMTTQRNYGSRALVYYIEGNERAVADAAQTIARNEHKVRVVSRSIREEGPRTALAVAKLRERGLMDEARRAAARMK